MQIYSFNENTKELLINTLREVDYIDACTPAIPMSAVIADQILPNFGKQQALIVNTEKNSKNYFTVSENIEITEDYRQTVVYNTATGKEETVTQLGPLPDNLTLQAPPDGYHEWDGKNWVEKTNADELRLLDQRRNAGTLNRYQFLSQMEIKFSKNKDQLVSMAERQLTGIQLIKTRNSLLESQSFNLNNDDLWLFLKEIMNLSNEEIFLLWQEAKEL